MARDSEFLIKKIESKRQACRTGKKFLEQNSGHGVPMGHHSSMSQSTANTGQLPSNGPVTGQRRRGSKPCLCSCMIIVTFFK